MSALFCITRTGVSKAVFRPSVAAAITCAMYVGHYGAAYVSPKTDHIVANAALVAIWNQGEAGSCTAQAGCGALAIKQYGKCEPRSTLHCYLLERDAIGTPDEDCGGDSQHVLQVMRGTGVCAESLFPYTDQLFEVDGTAKRPSIDALRDASENRVPSAEWASCANLDAVEQAVRADHPVIFGSEVDEKIQSYKCGDILGAPDFRAIIGGHEMVIVGVRYLDGERVWIIRNSWGTDYGEQGYLLANDAFLGNPSVSGSMFALLAA